MQDPQAPIKLSSRCFFDIVRQILVGGLILKNFGVGLEPTIKRNGLFVFWCLTLDALRFTFQDIHVKELKGEGDH
jgi:hypothetical protein